MSTLILAAMALSFAAMMPASAQGNSGTIKVHDGPDARPDTRNEPHVEGDFFVEGFNMAEDGGDLLFYDWPPTGTGELVLATTWDADDGEPEFHFLAGPFDLPCGHYRVFAYNGDGPDDPSEPQPGGAKKKTFWVECPPAEEPECGEPGAPPCPEEPECGEPGAPPCPPPDCGEPGAPPCPEEPPCGEPGAPACPEEPECGEPGAPPCPEEPAMECPSDIDAIANPDGSVTLTFTPAAGSDGTNIYRADGDGDFDYVTTVGPEVDTYTDTTTEAGLAYSYYLTGLYGNEESEGCEVNEVTAIPVFPSAIAFGLATLLGAGAYLALTMRRKA